MGASAARERDVSLNMPDAPATRHLTTNVGCEFHYDTPWATAAVFVVRPLTDDRAQLLSETWSSEPYLPLRDYVDLYGNACRRLVLPPGPVRVRYDAFVEVTGDLDPIDPRAEQHDPSELPDGVLIYTLPSRFAQSDLLGDEAWRRFGATKPGWERVQAIVDFVHHHLTFGYGSSIATTSAVDVFASGRGVCRDFAHLAIAFCRAMNVPARYVFGYLPDIDVPISPLPMDFCAWFEAFLGGRWWTFDPRNNQRRIARALIARGRDALDVAMVTTFGRADLQTMTVWADRTETA